MNKFIKYFLESKSFLALISLSIIIFLWFLATDLHWVNSLFLPSPSQIIKEFQQIITNGFMGATLFQHLGASFSRIFVALIFAIIIGVPLGIIMGMNFIFDGLVDPIIELYRPVPPLAYLPLLVIWFGIGELTKILLIFLTMLAPIIISTVNGVKQAQGNRINVMHSLGANKLQILKYVLLPAALPDILTGIRIGLGIGWATLVAAELVAAERGIGHMIQTASQFLQTGVVIIGIIIIALVAVILEFSLRLLQHNLSPWYSYSK